MDQVLIQRAIEGDERSLQTLWSQHSPHIDAVDPDSVVVPSGAVVQVVLRGHAFAPGQPGQNVVQFGDVRLTGVPANGDGTQISVTIPDRVPVRGDAAPLPLESGRYPIHVETAAGTSNTVSLRVDR